MEYKRAILIGLIVIALVTAPVSAGLFDFLFPRGQQVFPDDTPYTPLMKNLKITKTDIQFDVLKSHNVRLFNPDTRTELTGYSATDDGTYLNIVASKNGGAIAFTDGESVTIIRSRI
jgi:hypothetical protein